jgi:hypothetical protein
VIVSIHQPNFIPWIGYFYKIAKSDIFVILDDVQFAKNGFTNRNKIKTPQGELWLTLPITQSGKFGQSVNECIVQKKHFNVAKILKSIRVNYIKAPHFDWLINDLEQTLSLETENLSDLNVGLIKLVCHKLQIKTPMVLSSVLQNITGSSTERLIVICKNVGADKYLYGFGATSYQENVAFENAGITPQKTTFIHPEYKQLWGNFMSNLSVIDFMFNKGEEAIDFFKQ